MFESQRVSGSLPEILPPSEKRFCALQHIDENANLRISGTIGIAKAIDSRFKKDQSQ
jgi:hypothetical protein